MYARAEGRGKRISGLDVAALRPDAGGVARRRAECHAVTVNPLRFLVEAFVNTFGITRPSPQQETRAGWFLAVMLVLVAVFLVVVAWMLRGALAR